jgi:hypothetical protein
MGNTYTYNLPNSPFIIRINDSNGFPVNFTQTAFKDLRVANLHAEAGWTFIYNVNTDLVNVTKSPSASVTQSNAKGVLQTGAVSNSSAQVQSRKFARYIPGMGLLTEVTAVFSQGVEGNTQLIGIGDSTNGFFFGYNGTSFGVLQRQNSTDNWIPQSSWNTDTLMGTGLSGMTLDSTKGNIYTIEFQWLGFGLITFGVVNPSTGSVIAVHSIVYANTSVNPSIFTPNLPVMAQVANTTNNTNITLQTASAMIYLEGTPTNANSTANGVANNSVSISANTETNILTIQNKPLVSNITNHVPVILQSLSLSTDGNQNVSVRLIRNSPLTGSTTFTDINSTSSVVAYNTAGTYTTGTGKFVAGFQLHKTDGQTFNLVDYQYTLQPNETITIAALSTGNNVMTVTINWREYY